MILDLTQGWLSDNSQYKAWKFPGGELHFKLKEEYISYLNTNDEEDVIIDVRLKSSDDIMFLLIVLDTLNKDWDTRTIRVYIPYMPYQQADCDFGLGECFSLKTITKLLNSYPNVIYHVTDAHSHITGALLNEVCLHDNSEFINDVLELIPNIDALTIVSPDAGAYKKIFKLAEKIGFKGAIECANKYRDTTNGEIQVRLSCEDFGSNDILIIDDICIGGRTFVELAKLIKPRTKGNLYLAVTHGIFSNRFGELSRYFHGIYTTNSWNIEKDITQDIGWSVTRSRGLPSSSLNPDFFVNILDLY